jgi:hypothetical protein
MLCKMKCSWHCRAQPAAGQEFLGWSGDTNGTANPLAVTLSQSKVIHAHFSKRPRLTFSRCGGGFGDYGFRFGIEGECGGIYRIDGTTDLADWSSLATITNRFGTDQFTDPAATNLERRFYRAVEIVVPIEPGPAFRGSAEGK